MAEESVAEQNRRKLAEHLAKMQEKAGKGEKLKDAKTEANAGGNTDPLRDIPKPPPPPPGWDAWKKAHGGRMHTVRYKDAGQVADEADRKLLGVDKGASKEEIRKAFTKLAKEHHPDIGGDAEIYMAMQAAYKRLMK